eukprot:UN09891
MEMEDSDNDGIDMDDYILCEDMNDMMLDREKEWNEQSKMKHALHVDTIESKYKQRYENMEEKLNGNIKELGENNNELVKELNGNRNDINRLQTQLNNVENDRIKLLHSFMSEMDRMRDEIKKLNDRKHSQR